MIEFNLGYLIGVILMYFLSFIGGDPIYAVIGAILGVILSEIVSRLVPLEVKKKWVWKKARN